MPKNANVICEGSLMLFVQMQGAICIQVPKGNEILSWATKLWNLIQRATKYCHGQQSSESWPKGQRNIAMGNQALKVDPKGNKILPWATKLWKLTQRVTKYCHGQPSSESWIRVSCDKINVLEICIEVAISRFSYLLFVIAWAEGLYSTLLEHKCIESF